MPKGQGYATQRTSAPKIKDNPRAASNMSTGSNKSSPSRGKAAPMEFGRAPRLP